MATIELTGAEEVAWDLSDLYDGIDDPRIDADIARGRGGRGRVPRPLLRQGRRRSTPASSPPRSPSASGSRPIVDRALTLRTPPLHDEHGGPRPRRARRPLRERAADARDAAPLLRARVGGARGRARPRRCSPSRRSTTGATTSRRCASTGRTSSAEPEEKIVTEKTVSGVAAWSRLYEELLGAMRVDARRRDQVGSRRRWPGSTRPTATSAAGRPRRSPRRSSPACGRARTSSTRSCSTSRSTTGFAATRPGSRRATSSNETTDEAVQALIDGVDVALRRRAALLPPQGAAARARPARPLRPVRAGRRGRRRRRPGTRRERLVVEAYDDVLRRGRRDRRTVLRRELDRRAGAARQAHRRVLRHHRAGRPPVHPHELHRRPALDPDARARARSRRCTACSRSRSASSTRRRR